VEAVTIKIAFEECGGQSKRLLSGGALVDALSLKVM
jgi:hypothetical protein